MKNTIKWTDPSEDKLEEFVTALKEKVFSEYPDAKFVESKEGCRRANRGWTCNQEKSHRRHAAFLRLLGKI